VIEVKAGEVEAVIDGARATHTAGEYWVVPERAKLAIRVRSATGRGDNLVSMRGVVLIPK
jgi:hypothetical protein